MDFVDAMQQRTLVGLDTLFRGVGSLDFTDFPDYPNVGDSAIALGHLKYFSSRNISVRNITAIGTLSSRLVRSANAVFVNGGGNIGGLYPVIDHHRFEVAKALRPESAFIQGPQSVHFADQEIEKNFRELVLNRPGTRIGVRDSESAKLLSSDVAAVMLIPDAAHILGRLHGGQPSSRTVVLARQDIESAGKTPLDQETVDWLRDPFLLRWGSRFRWRSKKLGVASPILNPSPERWQRMAAQRLNRGIDILSAGEIVVTDRLHGMLLGLQLGRRVIAIDNNNHKLTKYAETWFGSLQPNLTFAKDLNEGVRLARHDRA